MGKRKQIQPFEEVLFEYKIKRFVEKTATWNQLSDGSEEWVVENGVWRIEGKRKFNKQRTSVIEEETAFLNEKPHWSMHYRGRVTEKYLGVIGDPNPLFQFLDEECLTKPDKTRPIRGPLGSLDVVRGTQGVVDNGTFQYRARAFGKINFLQGADSVESGARRVIYRGFFSAGIIS